MTSARGPARRAGASAKRFAGAVLKGARVLWRYAWAAPLRATDRPGPRATNPPRNRAYLHDRLVALPLLAAVAFAGLGFTATSLRDDSAAIRTHIAPALRDLADARTSLRIAQREAEVSLDAGDAVELSGLTPATAPGSPAPPRTSARSRAAAP